MIKNNVEIKTIQFKRGLKAVLEMKLTQSALGIPLAGEPIFETDTGKLKIGDGIKPYAELPYIAGGSVEGIPNFIIQDPLSNQVLLLLDFLHQLLKLRIQHYLPLNESYLLL